MPIEIRNQEFKKAMRGFDPVEVETFLDLVAGEYEVLINDNERLRKETATLETDLKHFREAEKTLKQTLYNVQKTSQLSKENSAKEASLIKKEAQLAAIQLVERARSEVHKMQEEVRALKRQKNSLISRLKHVLSSQIELLDVLSIDDDAPKGKNKVKPKKEAPSMEQSVENNKEKTENSAINDDLETPDIKKEDSTEKTKNQPKTKDKENNDNFFKDIFGDNIDIDEVLK